MYYKKEEARNKVVGNRNSSGAHDIQSISEPN